MNIDQSFIDQNTDRIRNLGKFILPDSITGSGLAYKLFHARENGILSESQVGFYCIGKSIGDYYFINCNGERSARGIKELGYPLNIELWSDRQKQLVRELYGRVPLRSSPSRWVFLGDEIEEWPENL